MREDPLAQPADVVVPGHLWALAGPIRNYVRRFPIHRGKGILIRRILLPILPSGSAVFAARLPGGGLVHLQPQEEVGFVTLLFGGFETAEVSWAIEAATTGSTAFDVGANVGIYSVALARAVGPDGCVIAVEPDSANVVRLRSNLALNSMTNIHVVEAVAGDRDGIVELHLADDPAYHSLIGIGGGRVEAGVTAVQSVRLDRVWKEQGHPDVSLIKVDVEGAEVDVLRGARELITAMHPPLLLEANDKSRLALLRQELEPLGYRRFERQGFKRWNHLFVWCAPTLPPDDPMAHRAS